MRIKNPRQCLASCSSLWLLNHKPGYLGFRSTRAHICMHAFPVLTPLGSAYLSSLPCFTLVWYLVGAVGKSPDGSSAHTPAAAFFHLSVVHSFSFPGRFFIRGCCCCCCCFILVTNWPHFYLHPKVSSELGVQ